MIDALISADFDVLAREHHRVPPLDAVLPRERAKPVRPTLRLNRWIPRVAVFGASYATSRTDWFDHHPQIAPLIVLSILSLFGLFDTGGVRASFARQLGTICAALALATTATTMFLVDLTSAPVLAVDREAALYLEHDDVIDPLVMVILSLAAVAGGYLVARLIASRLRPRDLRTWSALAAITIALVFVAWSFLRDFQSDHFVLVDFQLHRVRLNWYFNNQVWSAIRQVFWREPHDGHLSVSQIDMLFATGAITALLASIALALRSTRKIAGRWLAMLEHVAVAPIAIAVGMVSLVISLPPRDGGPDDVAGIAALAMAGVLVAFTSMTLRRLRRSTPGSVIAVG